MSLSDFAVRNPQFTVLIFLLLVFAIHPFLGWLTFAFAILQTLLAWLNERSTQKPMVEAARAARDAQSHADATVRNAEVIEAMGMLPAIQRRWRARQSEFLRLQATASDRAVVRRVFRATATAHAHPNSMR